MPDSPDTSPEFASNCPVHLNRRTFVGTTIAVGGVLASGPLLSGCSASEEEQSTSQAVRMTINGEPYEVTVDTRTSLLDMLRDRIDLTGTKKGCDQGACGACTILVDGQRIASCLTLAVMHGDAVLTTIEGLADGDRLHPLQQAFIDFDGLQCGYCTPGQIMSGLGCIAEGHAGSTAEIREWMSGNICRCGAYPNIVAAIAAAAGGA